jgi:hypothetical protein
VPVARSAISPNSAAIIVAKASLLGGGWQVAQPRCVISQPLAYADRPRWLVPGEVRPA